MSENLSNAGWRKDISSKLHKTTTNIAKFWLESDVNQDIDSLLQVIEELKALKRYTPEAKSWLKKHYGLPQDLVELYDVFDYVRLQNSVGVEMAPILMLLTEDMVNCNIKIPGAQNRHRFNGYETHYIDILDVMNGKYIDDRDVRLYTLVFDNFIKGDTNLYSCLENLSEFQMRGGYSLNIVILDPGLITHPRLYEACETIAKDSSDMTRRTRIFMSAAHKHNGHYVYLETDTVVHPLAHKSYKGFCDWLVKLMNAGVITNWEKMRYTFWASKFCHTSLKTLEQGEGSVPTQIKEELVPLMEKHGFKGSKYVVEVLDKMAYSVLVHGLSK